MRELLLLLLGAGIVALRAACNCSVEPLSVVPHLWRPLLSAATLDPTTSGPQLLPPITAQHHSPFTPLPPFNTLSVYTTQHNTHNTPVC